MEFAEGLGGLDEGVGEGLVPVHVRAAGAELPRALFAQGCRQCRADQLGEHRPFDDVGFGGTLYGRDGLGPGGGQRARDHGEDDADQAAVAAPLEAADGTAAEFERGGPVACQKRDRGRPDQVGDCLTLLACFAAFQKVSCRSGYSPRCSGLK